MRRSPAFLFPLLILLVAAVWFFSEGPPDVPGDRKAGAPPTAARQISYPALDKWSDATRPDKSPTPQELPGLIEMAKERAVTMKRWISEDPERALAQAISRARYEALPDELKPWFERPFAEMATLRVMPVCAPGAGTAPVRVLEMDGQSWTASVYGWRTGQITKENTPLVGITLDGEAAISTGFFQVIAADELASMPVGNPSPGNDFSTGEPLGRRPVVTVAHGKQYLFASSSSLEETNRKMAALDDSVAPGSGSNVVFALPSPGPDGGVDWEAAGAQVELQADAWSETPKNVFCIRVDFSNVPGQVVSQADLANVMNIDVKNSISEMSYGKTTITAGVSSTTVRMPQPSTFYLPEKNDALHTDAKNAYKAIAGASSLNGYDIVVVHFPSIGIKYGGVAYAGLAGGSNQWLQGTHSSGVIIHEFGHNYGIGHASFWETTNGSVVGAGTSVEYGDPTDIMGGGPDPEGHFHMQAKQRLGWLTSGQWQDATATGSGTRRIYRFDSPATTGALRGMRITKAASPAEYYWVGFRPGVPSQPLFQNSAYLIWQRPFQTQSWLVDTTPGSSLGKEDAAVAIGRTYSDTTAKVHVTPIGKGGSGADQWLDVNVQIGAFTGNTPPTATLTAGASATARSLVNLSANGADANGDTLAYSWDFGDGTTGENQASVTHRWLVGGTYIVKLTVSDMKGGVVTKTQNVAVTDPLSTWTIRNSGTEANLTDIAFGGGVLVAVGEDSGTYRRSVDGVTWTGGNIGLNVYLSGITHDGTRFIAVGQDYDDSISDWKGVIYTSPDGNTWTRRLFSGAPLEGVASSGGISVAVGEEGAIWRSVDTTNWSPSPSGSTEDLGDVSQGGGRFVIGGDAGTVLTSPDGSSWTNRASGSGLATWQDFSEMEYLNDRFLAGGWYAKIRHSTDLGNTFTTTQAVTRNIEGYAYGNGVFLAVGIDKDNADADINLISTDGATWAISTTANQDDRRDAVFFNNTFITVGENGSIRQSAVIAEASGGYAAWKQVNFPGSPPLSGANDDFDGDGMPNLVEYATGKNPKNSADRALITTTVQGGQLILTVPRDSSATGVTITAQTSTNLAVWTTTGVTILENTNTVFRAAIPLDTNKAFIRPFFSVN